MKLSDKGRGTGNRDCSIKYGEASRLTNRNHETEAILNDGNWLGVKIMQDLILRSRWGF
jgi:hypothetical protein